MDCSMPVSSSSAISRSLLKFMPIESVMLSSYLILCLPFLLLPSSFPSSGSFPMMSLLFNMLLRFAIAFLPRNKHLLISWLQSPPAVILEPKKLKSATASPFRPSICHLVMGLYAMINAKFFNAKFQPSLFTLLFYPLKRPFRSSSLPLEWYHLHI